MSATILIASAEHLAALKEREDMSDAQTFSDTEALRALDVITRSRPQVVALERLFAATSRGTALINRIKADPALGGCEIRIVSQDSPATRVAAPAAPPPPTANTPPVAAPAPTPVPASAPAAAPAAKTATAVADVQTSITALDQRGTRRAPRFRMTDGLEVQVDGKPAALIDLSVIGAQVISSTPLKPNQRIRLTLPNGSPPLRISAAVAWASFEIPKGGARYRAGIEFFDADSKSLNKFIEGNRQKARK